MPKIRVDSGRLQYERAGSGETVVFIGDVGFGPWQWGWQAPAVTGQFETVVWEFRGVGASTGQGVESVDQLVEDLEAILHSVESRRVHLVGAGLGGMVALRYARNASRVASLVVFNTAGSGAVIDTDALEALHPATDDRRQLRESLRYAFTDDFFQMAPETVEQICDWRATEDGNPAVVRAHIKAMESFTSNPLYEIDTPALVCHGIDNPVVSEETGRELAANLPHGTFVPVEGRHLCFAEHACAVNDRVLDFLSQQQSNR